MTKKTIILLSSIVALILATAGIYFWVTSQPHTPSGNIVFRERHRYLSEQSIIIVMDADGNSISVVGEYEGSPTWSPDGRYIAVGCEKEICILDFLTIPDMHSQLGPWNPEIDVAYYLPAPGACEEKSLQSYSGILSMSWSPSGEKLAVVCGSEYPTETRLVCILSLDGERECWDKSVSKDVYRVAWSPVDEDVIAIGGLDDLEDTSEIILVDPRGENPVSLARGWSPEWSPDGKQIAYFQNSPGGTIAIINSDGTGFHEIEISRYYWGTNCRGFTGTCRLSWSPDGRYLTFTGSKTQGIGLQLFRLDLQSEEAYMLIDSMIFRYPAEPDWGPVP